MTGERILNLTDVYSFKSVFFALVNIILKVLLVFIFYFVFFPVSIIFRVTGKDKLRRRIDPACESYWED